MIIPMRYTKFGYGYLDKVAYNLYHSGTDLNFGNGEDDHGLPIKAMADGTVAYSGWGAGGWGNIIVIYHPKYKVWSRYAHLNKCYYSKGTDVKEGDHIGDCGNTGGNWSSHLHWDILRKIPPNGLLQYTTWWSQAKVREYYHHPIPYVQSINASETQDEKPSEWAVRSWEWATKNEFVNGKDPKSPATREMVAEMLYKYDLKHNK